MAASASAHPLPGKPPPFSDLQSSVSTSLRLACCEGVCCVKASGRLAEPEHIVSSCTSTNEDRLILRLLCSEAAIERIAARGDSPDWLEAEYATTRSGLIRLRQNVVLLRHADSPDLFYPVS